MSHRLAKFLICLLLVVSVVCVYWQTGTHGAVNCDDYYITELDCFDNGVFSFDNFLFGLQYKVCGVWMPLTYLVVGVELALFGDNYGAWHLLAAAWHGLNAIILFLALNKMTRETWKSALVAGIFALHPLNVEAVAWLAAIRIVASATLALLSLYFYAAYARSLRFRMYCGAGVCFFFSIGVFPMFAPLPFLFILLDIWPFGRLETETPTRLIGHSPEPSAEPSVARRFAGGICRLIWEKYFFFLVMVVAGLVVIGSHDLPAVYHYPLPIRILNAILSYGRYLSKLVWPANLAAFYPYPTEFLAREIAGVAAILVGITALGLTLAKRYPYVIIGWLWFVGMVFPFIGIAQVGTQAMADHYTYLAMAGFWIVIVWGGADFGRFLPYWKFLSGVAGILLVIIYAGVSWHQAGYWKDSETLSRRMLQVTDNNYEAYNYLGQALAVDGQIEQAIDAFSTGLAIKPDHLNMNFNMAQALTRQGKNERAIKYYQRLLAVDPGHITAHNNLGALFYSLGDTVDAEYHYRRAVSLAPDYLPAVRNLADLLLDDDRPEAAVRYYRRTLCRAVDKADAHYRLACAYLQLGQTDRAIAHFKEAAGLRPGDTRLQGMLQELSGGGSWCGNDERR